VLQLTITDRLEAIDGQARFREDSWERPGGGGGHSRVIEQGAVFEKGGVNFSEVHGEFTPEMAQQMPGDGTAFYATGVSLVLHPRNPHVPTVHMNYRYLQHGSRAWFGGGADLTPFYPVLEDVVHFHRTYRDVCARFSQIAPHAKLKRDCDDYFYLKHRHEARGVGGIFFDYLSTEPKANENPWEFIQAAGEAFLPSYVPIVQRRQRTPYTADQRAFQEYRRGRYVEFNLIYDRGTLFGLKTNGRTESILMSLPPVVRYQYDYQPPAGSQEARLTTDWLQPRDWANLTVTTA
jgi:coproporphyrinogen III oxidase